MVPEEEEREREKGTENLSEGLITKNSPNLVKEIAIQTRNDRVPNKMNSKRPKPRPIMIKR